MSVQLELQSLTKIFGPKPEHALTRVNVGIGKAALLQKTAHVLAVHDVNLRIQAGELFVIMGLSGSGKSTLVRLINRLIEPTSGRILLGDKDVSAMTQRELMGIRRGRISMVFQSFALLPHRTVLDNVAFGLEVAGVSRAERHGRAREALQLVDIAEMANRLPAELSGGMRQRVGLARAWVTEPDVLLMDEAFSALDPLIRAEMQDALVALQRGQQRTIVFISHDLAEAVRIADRIAVMADGSIRQVGTPKEIITHPADDFVRAFFRDVQPGRLFTAGDIAVPAAPDDDALPVSRHALLEDILPQAAASEQPLAVLDDAGQCLGRITRSDLLRALMRRDAL